VDRGTAINYRKKKPGFIYCTYLEIENLRFYIRGYRGAIWKSGGTDNICDSPDTNEKIGNQE